IETMQVALVQGYLRARTPIADARIARCGVLAGKGEHTRAAEEVETIARQGDLQSVTLYNMACFYSRSVAGVDRDRKLSAVDREHYKVRYGDRAMDLLRLALAKGWGAPAMIKGDADLKPLRARQDFQKLLADLEGKRKEKVGK